jgi:PAS domain S-box-containing protein
MYASNHVIQPDELVQAAFDSLREPVCVLDCDGLIVVTNHAWNQSARENGADPRRCGLGVNYLQVCRTATGPYAAHALEAAIGIGTVLRGSACQFTLDYPCPSPLRKAWFRLSARPLRRPSQGAIIQHSEISHQVALAETLRRTRAYYGALLENPVQVATVLAPDGTVRYQSPASESVLGVRAAELAGRPIFEFIHPDDWDAMRQVLRACLRYPRRKQLCECRFRSRDGSWRVLESVASNLHSHPGGGIILNSRDITIQKRAEKTLLARQAALVRDRDDLEALAARLFRTREEERRRLATELNGKLTQRLASMSLQAAHMAPGVAAAGELHALENCIAVLGSDFHQLGSALYPGLLDHFGLAVALREYCAEFMRRETIPIQYVHRGISARLPVRIAVALYRVAEEALANVSKHAHASRAWVTLSRASTGLRLTIRDDGSGFDPAAVEPGAGLGILAMRERLRDVKGSLSIRSRPGGGTEIVALAPPAELLAVPLPEN